MIVLTTPEPTVRPPSRNHFAVWLTILSLIFLVFQHFCLLKACVILVALKIGAKMEPAHFFTLSHNTSYISSRFRMDMGHLDKPCSYELLEN